MEQNVPWTPVYFLTGRLPACIQEDEMSDAPDNTLHGISTMPSFTVNNLQQSMAFFAGLGFEIEDRWEDKGVLLGAMLKGGNVRLGLSQDDGKKGRDHGK